MKCSNDSHPPAATTAARSRAATAAECCCSSADSGGRIERGTDEVIIASYAKRSTRVSKRRRSSCTVRQAPGGKDRIHHGRRPARGRGYRPHVARGWREHRAPLSKLVGGCDRARPGVERCRARAPRRSSAAIFSRSTNCRRSPRQRARLSVDSTFWSTMPRRSIRHRSATSAKSTGTTSSEPTSRRRCFCRKPWRRHCMPTRDSSSISPTFTACGPCAATRYIASPRPGSSC